MHLWPKTWQNLTNIDTCENIRLIQACIYHDHDNSLSKGNWIMVIHHSLLSQGLALSQCDDPKRYSAAGFLRMVLFHPGIYLVMKNRCCYTHLLNLWSNTLHWHYI